MRRASAWSSSPRATRSSLRHAIPLTYRGVKIDASSYADMIVDGCVIVELKAVESLAPIHEVQLLTYLRLANCPVGLLINFNVSC